MRPVLLIGDSPITMSPYISSYVEVYERNNIPYELIFWNKTMEDPSRFPECYIPYNRPHDNRTNGFIKIFRISGFARFVKQHMMKQEYSYVVVFTIAHALFFYDYLTKNYNSRYIFDIRDYSPLCKLHFCFHRVKKLIDNSAYTVISSKGFLRWLPKVADSKFVLSHNMLLRAIELSSRETQRVNKKKLNILTIGQIAYFESQLYFIQQLSNDMDFSMHFAGFGPAVFKLKDYVDSHQINNVEFSGRYEKCDEPSIVSKADFINIWLKSDINADSCMANRFYLSALFRKPMIVHEGSYMAELCIQYSLGIVLGERENFGTSIKEWLKNYNHDIFVNGCNEYLSMVKQDILTFENKLIALC